MPEQTALTSTRVPLPGTSNLRDLGGLPAADGTVIAPGRLYRAELLALTPSGAILTSYDPQHASDFRRLGVRTILDLRSDREFEANPSAWPEATGGIATRYVFDEGGEGEDTGIVMQILSGQLASFGPEDLADFYRGTIDRSGPMFVEAITALTAVGSLPALIHCTAGKDRTGMLVALVLELLGVPREHVIADYAHTQVLRPNRVAAYAPQIRAAGVDPDAVRGVFETPPQSMGDTLLHVDREYGGVSAYLSAAGMDPGVAPALRRSLLVPGSRARDVQPAG